MTRSGYVALKVNISRIQGTSNECSILRWMQDLENDQPKLRDQNIIRLLDDFIINGPNGNHDCMVTELLGAMSDFRHSPAFSEYKMDISWQILYGLSYCIYTSEAWHMAVRPFVHPL